MESFSYSPITLLNDFVSYLQEKHDQRVVQDGAISQRIDEYVALLSKFIGLLINVNYENNQDILITFTTTLKISNL